MGLPPPLPVDPRCTPAQGLPCLLSSQLSSQLQRWGGLGVQCAHRIGFSPGIMQGTEYQAREAPPGPPAHLLHVRNIGLPSKSCLPQAGGAWEGSRGEPRPEPLYPGRAGAPRPASCIESEKRNSIVYAHSSEPAWAAGLREPWRGEPGHQRAWLPGTGAWGATACPVGDLGPPSHSTDSS